MHVRLWLISVIAILPLALWSQQEGCTDPKARNYNPEAIVNDGSCVYPSRLYRPPVIVQQLPDSINETSGLIWWRNSYWTHNDSEGGNYIFRLDTAQAKIIQKITVGDARNIDWEDIDHDDDFIYVGDFGNNLGSRNDQVIYKISKTLIPDSGDVEVTAERIYLRYGDQSDFTVRNRANDFDCEALISFGDSLYLFTKNWATLTCRLYAVPKASGSYVIFPLDEFDADGLITGAAIDHISKELILIGYKNYIPFVWILNSYWRNDFFGGNKRRIDFWELVGSQTEGITAISEGHFIISSEKTPVNNAKLFRFDVKEID